MQMDTNKLLPHLKQRFSHAFVVVVVVAAVVVCNIFSFEWNFFKQTIFEIAIHVVNDNC
jgi:hypothetical protein